MTKSALSTLVITVVAGLIVYYLTKSKCACSEGNVA